MQTEIDVQASAATQTGKIIALVSNKGGVGTTTAAINISTNFARRSRSVCLVDLILQSGSVTGFLNVEPACSLLDLAKSLRRADPLVIEEALVQHVSGVRVLAEPLHGAAEPRIKPADVDELFDRLVQSFDLIVVDTPKACGDMQLLALDRAELILFVTEMDAPSLKSARRTMDHFHRTGVDIGKIRVLLNRYIKMEVMNLQAIEKILGTNVFWTVPNDYPAVLSAVNQGLALESCDYDSEIARSYAALPNALMQSLALSL